MSAQKITPFLWFDGQAEQAIEFYTGIFRNARVTDVARYGDAGPGPKGSVMTATFEIEGQRFHALNGGPMYRFTPAISFVVGCETQAEIDHYWDRLCDGGQKQPCGWLVDRFGVSWQVIPHVLGRLMSDPDPARAARAMQAMMTMSKLDIAALERAARGD